MSPFDHKTVDFEQTLTPLIKMIGQITDIKVVPNEQIKKATKPPFVTYYPLTFDDPVFGDATANDGQFEAVISLDVFADTLSVGMQKCGDLRSYLLDRYTRQLLKRDGHIAIRSASVPQTRSITDLPFSTVHHHGFDLTIQYFRKYQSPIDTITSVGGFSYTTKEDE
ncbi:LIC_12616 family protein [Levilactobacillus tangyuanensis]|uniref:LIC_12616 family protein n=1 Tax=Levilactobacillus tangyuanensis TaxID=2486021 RepID=A0ABW1TP65_9LACO|nr:hypothetical protein [Levilactobacillus tangyuanensis]